MQLLAVANTKYYSKYKYFFNKPLTKKTSNKFNSTYLKAFSARAQRATQQIDLRLQAYKQFNYMIQPPQNKDARFYPQRQPRNLIKEFNNSFSIFTQEPLVDRIVKTNTSTHCLER